MNKTTPTWLALLLAASTLGTNAQEVYHYHLKTDTSATIYEFNNDTNGALSFVDPNGEAVDSSLVEINAHPHIQLQDKTLTISATGNAEGLCKVKDQSGKYGFVDQQGALVIACTFDETGRFSEGLAQVQKNGTWGYIDKTGALVIPFSFQSSLAFRQGRAAVKQNGKYGYINKKGEYVISPVFLNAGIFSQDRAVATDDGHTYYYIDTTGHQVFPGQFAEAQAFHGGLAAVRTGYTWHYINPKGETVISGAFKKAGSFYGPLAQVTLGTYTQTVVYTHPNHIQIAHYDKYAYIDKTGDTVFEWSAPPSFADDALTLLRNPMAANQTPMTRVTVTSNPPDAKVYFIPSHILEDDSDIVNQPNKLASRLQTLHTNATYTLYLQDYSVIVASGSKARLRKFNPFPETPYTLDFDFSALPE
jgi:hypothetical protein